MVANKVHIRRDDVVEVLAGRDRGKKGRVLRVFPKKSRALVEGVNFINKAVRPDAKMNQTGGFVRKEGLIHLSNLRKAAEGGKAKKGAE